MEGPDALKASPQGHVSSNKVVPSTSSQAAPPAAVGPLFKCQECGGHFSFKPPCISVLFLLKYIQRGKGIIKHTCTYTQAHIHAHTIECAHTKSSFAKKLRLIKKKLVHLKIIVVKLATSKGKHSIFIIETNVCEVWLLHS